MSKYDDSMKHDNRRIFVADLIDVVAKGDIDSMEHPIFSLSKRSDKSVFKYHSPTTGVWIEVAPSMFGRATIYDKDLLLYCTGQVVEGANRGRPISRRVRITAYDYLITTGRGTGGKAYQEIHKSLARLRGTTFKTNMHCGPNGRSSGEVFGLIDDAELITDESGRLVYIDITLSTHVFRAIERRRILSYNREYFSLSPSERRLYEILRKHCGSQAKWENRVEHLHSKFGARSSLREFRRTLRRVIEEQTIPDYDVSLDSVRDVVIGRYCPPDTVEA